MRVSRLLSMISSRFTLLQGTWEISRWISRETNDRVQDKLNAKKIRMDR